MKFLSAAKKFKNASFKKYPYTYHFLLRLLALVYRYILMTNTFDFISCFTLISIILQIIVLFFFNKLKKKMKKSFYLINVFSLYAHLFHIYFSFLKKNEFWTGMETAIIIFANFTKIKNTSVRFIILICVFFAFLKKKNFIDIDSFKLIYMSYLLILFDFFIFWNCRKSKANKNVKVPVSHKGLIIDESQSITNQLSSEKSIPADQNSLIEILNRINIGVLMMDQDLNLIYKNNFFSETFKIEDNIELKEVICSLEENIDWSESDFYKIPEIELQKLFEHTMRFTKSLEHIKMDDFSGKFHLKKQLFEEIFNSSRSRAKSKTIVQKMDTKDSIFKGWIKKILKENLDKRFLDYYTKDIKKKQPKSVLKYLKKMLKYYAEPNKDEELEGNSFLAKKVDKFSMYTSFSSNNEEEEKDKMHSYHLNFYPLKNIENKEANESCKILITIRGLSELETKYLESVSSNNKMLGSFCHELRTPINVLINMLDIMQSKIEESHGNNNCKNDEDFEELLSNSVVNSVLLLNQIDDFIDYFALCNEMLELHVVPFNLQSFLNDINRVISFVTVKKKINFKIEIDSNIPSLISNDSQKLKRIIYNLINNSIRFTNSGGLIKVCAKLKKNNYIRISVLDTGLGIKEEELSFLGKINDNAQDLHKNTCGLGLFMCNILCLMIENEGLSKRRGLTVYSEHGMGTCFNFYFRYDMNSELCDLSDAKLSKNSFSNDKKEQKEQNTFIFPKGSSIFQREKFATLSSKEKFSTFESHEIKNKIFSNQSIEKLPKPVSIISEEIISNRSIDFNHTLMSNGNCKFLKKEKVNSKPEIPSLIDLSFSVLDDCKCAKVLIVDDVPFNIEACSRILTKFKIPSDSATNGLDAVEKITNILNNSTFEKNFCCNCRFYKLILMDVDMPIKNGIKATEEILKLLKNTDFSVSIVGLSAFDQIDVARRGMEAGMCEYVTKPIQAQKIKELILKYLCTK